MCRNIIMLECINLIQFFFSYEYNSIIKIRWNWNDKVLRHEKKTIQPKKKCFKWIDIH